ncbi:MAG: LysM peptidoglycan-binding domain-containing protein [Lachnospiraceae bacterium]|nr:LysM peptidoglycan-binding domain-containing protein [Lachnospiraceae bacterium]
MAIYVVRAGDTLEAIASEFNREVSELSEINQIPYPYRMAVGQALLIPERNENDVSRRSVQSGGYAYPFISNWVLDQTLPYLTKLFIFSYGFTTEGELIPPARSEDFMLEKAGQTGVLPILVLTPLGADGRFSNILIQRMVNDSTVKENLINHLLEVVQEKGYAGVDVDFEYILAEDRDLFTSFVAELSEAMREIGKTVSVALAPKTSADQQGLLYQGKDYGGLGAVADEVLLMTYEWGYTYGPAMAVAPLNKVRQVVEYALTEIPAEKINLGIANYGYDWTLPYVKGESKAVTIGNVEAVQIAIENGVEIQFDKVVRSPFFQYEKEGRTHEVWFEDVRSLQGKYDLIKEFGLRGFGVWQIMRFFRAEWELMLENFTI